MLVRLTVNEMHLQKKNTKNSKKHVAQYPLHHESYAHATFQVASSNGLGGDAFTKTHYYILWHWVKVTQYVAH